jgi:hypothetical protein
MADLQELTVISHKPDTSSRKIHSGIVVVLEMDSLCQEDGGQKKGELHA